VPKPQNRLYIITSDFTEDTKIKKQFTSNLNKLTDTNKQSIYQKMKELIAAVKDRELQECLYSTVWDFIRKDAAELYVNVLKFFNPTMTIDYVKKHISEKEWYPPDYALQNNLHVSKNELYDSYCDYTKWKKGTLNIMRIVCNITDNDQLDKLSTDIYDLFFEHLYQQETKHIVYCALEMLQIILKKRSSASKQIVASLRAISVEELDSSCRFLIMDIIDATS
jgi:hypothetical protein